MSDSGMPLAANPWMIAGQFVSACPPIARDSASCCISSRRAPLVAFMGVCLSVKEGRISGRTARERSRRASARGPECSAEHFAGFNGLEGGAEIVAGILNQLDVALQGLAVQPF